MNEPKIEIENPEVFSKQLIAALVGNPDGFQKEASEAGSAMIRRRIRENGFMRLILPPKLVSDKDLTPLPDTELPVIVEEMEPDSAGAKSISFNDTADTQFYRADKFVCYFSKITTPEFTKNINELRTYRGDVRAVVTDNSLKDVQTEEDARGIKTVDLIVGSTSGVGASGLQQNFTMGGSIDRNRYKDVLSHLEDRNLNNGVFLLNRKTAKAFLGFGRDVIGGDLAEKLLKDGLSALEEAKLFGVRHLFTIKRDLVPDGVVYEFAEPNYLGKFYELQPVTMYVEKKKDILRFSAQELISVTFANVAGLGKANFTWP